MLALNWLKTNWKIATIIACAATVFGLITFVNHVHFRTYALDLGAYTNAAYKYAHFVLADNDVFMAEHSPMLSGHFDLYLVLFSNMHPRRWLNFDRRLCLDDLLKQIQK